MLKIIKLGTKDNFKTNFTLTPNFITLIEPVKETTVWEYLSSCLI
jgi:hypothetical protein